MDRGAWQATVHGVSCKSQTRLSSYTTTAKSPVGPRGKLGTALVVQGLRLCTPNAGDLGSALGQGSKSCMLQLRFCMLQLRPVQSNS